MTDKLFVVGDGALEGVAVHAGAVEATGAFFAFGHHIHGGFDSFDAGFGLFAGGDPRNPIAARDGGGFVPCGLGIGVCIESLLEVVGNFWFGFDFAGGYFEGEFVSDLNIGILLKLFRDF